MGPTYQYAARIDRCIDGDSLAVTLQLGFSVTISQQLRLLGVDCAEKRGYREMPDLKKLGQLATQFVSDTVKEKGKDCIIISHKDGKGKFGRLLAEVWWPGMEISLNDLLIDEHLAVAYHGQSKSEIYQEHIRCMWWHKTAGNIE